MKIETVIEQLVRLNVNGRFDEGIKDLKQLEKDLAQLDEFRKVDNIDDFFYKFIKRKVENETELERMVNSINQMADFLSNLIEARIVDKDKFWFLSDGLKQLGKLIESKKMEETDPESLKRKISWNLHMLFLWTEALMANPHYLDRKVLCRQLLNIMQTNFLGEQLLNLMQTNPLGDAVNINYIEKKLREDGIDEDLIKEMKEFYQVSQNTQLDIPPGFAVFMGYWDVKHPSDEFLLKFLVMKKFKELLEKVEHNEETASEEAKKLVNFTKSLIESGLVINKEPFNIFIRSIWSYMYIGENVYEFAKGIHAGYEGIPLSGVNLNLEQVEKRLKEVGVDENIIKEFKESYQDLVKDALDNDHVFFKFIYRKRKKVEKTKNYEEAVQLKSFVDKLIQSGLVEWKDYFANFNRRLLQPLLEELKQVQKQKNSGQMDNIWMVYYKPDVTKQSSQKKSNKKQ